MSGKDDYLTPENFMRYLEVAVRKVHFQNTDWTELSHPADIAYNVIQAAEVVAAFFEEKIYCERTTRTYNPVKPTFTVTSSQAGMDGAPG